MYPEELEIILPSGISLQADLWKPSNLDSTSGEDNKLAVCLHPWSWLGGRKEDPSISSLIEPLADHGYHVLRYNSRGVGRSTGWASFTGFSEAEDLKSLITWAMDMISDVKSLVILGYSHGSLIASLYPILPSVKTSHILLSYPLGPRAFLTLFNSSSYIKALHELVQHPESNVLIIFGDRDEFTSQSKYNAWISDLQGAHVEIHEVENASHFWHGRSARALTTIVKKWLP